MELLKSDMQHELEDLVTRLMRDKNAFSDLQEQLAQSGIDCGDLDDKDPFELLPGWLHKR